ncbi:hypothetical protein WMF30_51660 [Sorangium sp. So ce134]
MVVLGGWLFSTPSSAADFTLRAIEDQDPVVTIEGDADLAHLDAEIRRQLPDAIRNAAPDLFQDRTVLFLRYVNVTAAVTDVRFTTGATPQEIVIRATVLIRADRERLTRRLAWRSDGNADVASVDLDGRISVKPDGPSALKASALLDQVRLQISLQLFNGVSARVSLGGREVGSRSFEIAPSAYVPAGTTITSYGVSGIEGKTARVRLVLNLPAAVTAPGDAGAPHP